MDPLGNAGCIADGLPPNFRLRLPVEIQLLAVPHHVSGSGQAIKRKARQLAGFSWVSRICERPVQTRLIGCAGSPSRTRLSDPNSPLQGKIQGFASKNGPASVLYPACTSCKVSIAQQPSCLGQWQAPRLDRDLPSFQKFARLSSLAPPRRDERRGQLIGIR